MFKKNNLILLLFLFLNYSYSYSYSSFIDPIINNEDELSILQDSDITIGYIKKDYPWCQGTMVINNSIKKILNVIEDVENYYKFFDSLSISKINNNDEVLIRIDMPMPFDDRDYAITFNKFMNESEVFYSFSSIISDDYPVEKDCVRLVNAKGEWHLKKISDNKTLVKYTWNGQMLGSFPLWAYTTAWTQQGNEILTCLKREVERRKND